MLEGLGRLGSTIGIIIVLALAAAAVRGYARLLDSALGAALLVLAGIASIVLGILPVVGLVLSIIGVGLLIRRSQARRAAAVAA